jgi:hypothetical protein
MTTQFTKVDVNDTRKGDYVMVVTGSAKTRDLLRHVGQIVDYTIKNIEGTDLAFLNVVIQTTTGIVVESSRVHTIDDVIEEIEDVQADVDTSDIVPTIDETYPEHDSHMEMMDRELINYIHHFRQHMSRDERIAWRIDYSKRYGAMMDRRNERVQLHLQLVSAILIDAS